MLTLLLGLCTVSMWAVLSTFQRYDYSLVYRAGEEGTQASTVTLFVHLFSVTNATMATIMSAKQ
jgi:hypothetical protein